MLELFNYKNGNIVELISSEMRFPTNISIYESAKETKVLVASRVTSDVSIFKINPKIGKLLSSFHLP